MDNYQNKTKAELIAEIERLKQLNNSLKTKDGGGYLAKAAVAKNITEPKQTEIKLIQVNEQLSDTLENMSDGFVSLDKNWNYSYVNKRAGEMFGRKPEELVGKHIWTEFPEGINQPFYKTYYKVVKTQKQISFKDYYQPWDRWFENHVIPTTNGLSIFFQDITDRKKAEEKLKFSEEKFMSIYDQSPIAIQIYDLDGKLVSVNKKTLDLFGLNDEKYILGFNLWEDPNLSPEKSEALKKGDPIFISASFNFELIKGAIPFPTNREGIIYLDMYVVPLIQENENTGFLVQIVETTNQKNIEVSLRESQTFNETLLYTSPDVIYIYDIVESKNIYSNEGINKILGYSIEEVQEMGNELIPTLMHKEDFKNYFNVTLPCYQTAKDGELVEHEYRMKHKNGEWYWLHSKESIFERLPDGSPKQIFGIISDITIRKQSELALIQEKNKAQQYLDIAEVILLSIDSDGLVQLINPKGCEVLGYSEDEIIGKNWFDNFLPERMRKTVKEVATKVNSGEIESIKYYENEILTKSGEEKIIAWNNSVLKDKKGNILGTLSSGEDITVKEEAVNKLKKSEERFNLAMKASDDGLFDWNLETNEIYYSPGWKRMLGYEEHELPNDFSVWEKTTESEDVKKSWELQQQLIAKQIDRFVLEFKMKHKEGHRLDILSRAEAIFNENGKAIRIVGTHVDITERKQAEDKLKESEEKFRTLIDEIPAGVYLTDLDGKCNYVNPTWCKMGGLSLEEAKDDGWKKGIHPEDRDLVSLNWNKMIKSNGSWGFEYRMFDGVNASWVDGRAKELKSDGKLIGYLGINTDITELKNSKNILIDSKNRLEAIFNNTKDYQLLVKPETDNNFRIIAVNQSYIEKANQLGLAIDEIDLIGKTFKEVMTTLMFIKEEVAVDILKNYVKVVQTKEQMEFIEDLKVNDKDYYAEISLTPVLDAQGDCKYILYNSHDISEKKNAEKELEKHRIHLEKLVKERTKDLEVKNKELERFNDLFVDREIRIKELREQIKIHEKNK